MAVALTAECDWDRMVADTPGLALLPFEKRTWWVPYHTEDRRSSSLGDLQLEAGRFCRVPALASHASGDASCQSADSHLAAR